MIHRTNKKLNLLIKNNPFLSLLIGTFFSGIGLFIFSALNSINEEIISSQDLNNFNIIEIIQKVSDAKSLEVSAEEWKYDEYEKQKQNIIKRINKLNNMELLLLELVRSKSSKKEYKDKKEQYTDYFENTLQSYEQYLLKIRNLKDYCSLKNTDCSGINLKSMIETARSLASKIDIHEGFYMDVNNKNKSSNTVIRKIMALFSTKEGQSAAGTK